MYPGTFAASTPDKPAYVMAGSGLTVTYKELNDRSNQVARLLRARGLHRGDGMAVCTENNDTFHPVVWAGARSGLYYTAISSRLTAGEVEYIVDDCGAEVFITSYRLRDMAAGLTGKLPKVHTRLMVGGTIDGWDAYEDAVGAMPAAPIDDESLGSDMLYSSGTTGRPKGVRPPLRDEPAGSPSRVSLLSQLLYGFDAEMVYLSPAPLYHAAPLRFTMAVHRVGGTVVVMEHFDPIELLRLIERFCVTHTQLVPTMFIRLLKLPADVRSQFDLSSLQCVIHAAAPCPVPVKQQMIEWWGQKIFEYYAGTEANGFVAINSDEWMTHKGSVGRSLQGTLHIVDENGDDLPPGVSGTIYFEGGNTFEYHNDPDKTAASRHPKGWTTLGDIGYLDDDGYLYLTDRKANMIISGGVNIYPQEAENVLAMHPKVLDVAVFGIPNDEFGEEVKAVVQPVDMADAGAALERELIDYCKEQLSSIKCPRSVDFMDELPRQPTGKLYKRLLRDPYWEGRATRI
jgi:acyl-CoA synthetase (AMP-forming)/AMP-acid ligase II